ncbi:MAG TPA: cytochrome C oxidase subunit IV family protein [Mycobacteriales bacterium]|nr:cytochrome C oxidase subunit IV family protein [Mycobacteriales bacterium]
MTTPDAPDAGVARRLTTTWIAAALLTVVSWAVAIAVDGGHAKPSTAVAVIGLVLAAVKVRLIIQSFMDVRTAPRWLKVFTDAWLGVLSLAILVLYVAA